jgi:protein-S-isoprenylcysteine O-methyltransferase Ste14
MNMWHGLEPQDAVFYPWCLWAITWIAAALWTNRTVKRPGISRDFIYRALTFAGFVFLLGGVFRERAGRVEYGSWPGVLGKIYWQPSAGVGWGLVSGVFLGFLFAWWARLHLGRLWSGRITRKQDHHVVDSGPYAIVRHPIYTGILFSAVVTAVIVGAVHTYIGAGLLVVGYWIKARLEEQFLREELGAQDYDAYRRRVPMLVPFGPRSA